ncbi:MAG TPA: hypothetical protein VGF13_07065, partial [Verrucomicrobiae bacterium]
MKFNRLWCVWLLFAVVAPAQAATVNYFSYGSPWRFRLGTNEASVPISDWRTNSNDDGWSLPVPTPIGYGTPAPVTFIPESDEITPNWLCVFMRRTFVVANPAAVASATLSINIDDGYIVWINGTEITPRYNMPSGEPTTNFAASVAGEPVVLTHSVS